MKIILFILFVLLLFILDNKKLVNFRAIIDGIFFIVIFFTCLFMTFLSYRLLIKINISIYFNIFLLLILFCLSLFVLVLCKNHIFGCFRTIYYLIYKNKFIKYGKTINGTIIDIKYDAINRYYIKYYALVKVDERVIKSTYFLEKNKYKINKKVNVLKYKNKYLIMIL